MQIVRSERRESVLLLALIGVAAGCIVHGSLKPPSENGEQWLDLRSKHFHLMTDLDAEEAEGVVRSFEQGYARLGRVVFGSEAVPDFETEVIAFRSEGEFREFRPAPLSGQYLGQLPNDQEPTPTMLIYGGLSPENSILFTHELTHRFNHFALPAIPVWLNEGIAQYYSTVRGDVDHAARCADQCRQLGDIGVALFGSVVAGSVSGVAPGLHVVLAISIGLLLATGGLALGMAGRAA